MRIAQELNMIISKNLLVKSSLTDTGALKRYSVSLDLKSEAKDITKLETTSIKKNIRNPMVTRRSIRRNPISSIVTIYLKIKL